MSQYLEYLAAAEGSLFVKGLEPSEMMKQESPCKSRVAFLQTALES